MTVERIRKLDINNRPIFTGIYGNSYGQEYYVEDNLCKYNFWQELYRYLRSEEYTTLFYNSEYNFFSYEESQLETFFFRTPEQILSQANYLRQTQASRFIAPVASPNGQNRRKGIRLNANHDTQTNPAYESHVQTGLDVDANTEQLVSHRPNAILVKKTETDQFFQLKSNENVLERIFEFIDKNPGHKLAVIFTMPSEISFGSQEENWATKLQTRYSQQKHAGSNLRLLVSYDFKDVKALGESFQNHQKGFFFKSWFYDQMFPEYKDDRKDFYAPSEALFFVDDWGKDEVANILKRRRIMEGLKHTLEPIPFNDLCLRIWQQFKIDDRDIDTVEELMALPIEVLEENLQKINNEKAMDRLRKLQGIEGIIAQFERYLADLRACRENGEKFRKHMVFMGSPGTGKTTVARIFADVLREEGLLENGRLHQVKVGNLVGEYVGQTRIKTEAVCQKARGGVLFIDEAYGFYQSEKSGSGGGGGSNQYGLEAIEVLLQFMENDDSSLVILAGYQRKMEDMLKNSNEGFNSRIGNQGRFYFEDYNPDTLLKIALAELKGSTCTKQFSKDLRAIFAALAWFKDENWANARTAENTISEIKSNYRAQKLTGPYDSNAISDKLMRLIRVPSPQEEAVLLKDLNDMIGLSNIKEKLKSIFDSVKSWQRRATQYGYEEKREVKLNFVFKGNPGTGKTTVARLLGNILANYGLIKEPEVVTLTKGQLIDGSVGGGSRNVEEVFESAVGKVLFIDEAYQLSDADSKDALTALTNMLTDERYEDRLAVILAGYPGEMAELIGSNSGLKSRFTQDIFFENYTNDELTEIFRRKLVAEHFRIGKEAIAYAKAYFSSLHRDKDFGNARETEKLMEIVKGIQSKRTNKMVTDDMVITEEDDYTILPQDFPNYGKVNLDKFKSDKENASSPMDKLNKLVGIDGIRKQFAEYVKMAHYCQENPQAAVSKTFRPHMAFLGNPGTGKSTVARLFGEILREEGLLLNNNFVEVGPDDLIGQYVGQSAPKARAQFERARGGVLFIDEAYELYKKGKDGGNSFGQEVITALIKFMEDNRDTVVILAGYTEEIRYLIQFGNPGLKSRVTNEFFFEDYEPNVLFNILMNKLSECQLSQEFKVKMRQIIDYEYLHRDKKEWGNARDIENYAADIFRSFLVKHDAKGVIDVDCIPDNLIKDLS